MAARHVLFDADGVIQRVPADWYTALEPFVGDRARELARAVWAEDLPMLAGEGDLLVRLAAVLPGFGVVASPEEVATVWHQVEVDAASTSVVHRLRAAGHGVHLGTNQEPYRAAYMRTVLGYDDLFDVSCYSCDLGRTKPSAEFFAEAARRIGAEPAAIVFVDDWEPNVAGAVAAGMAGLHWSTADGHDTLLTGLAAVGVACRDA